ncbi:MAG: DinB family protein [Chloroflexota bacterium]
MTTWIQVHRRNIVLIDRMSARTVGNIIAGISQADATTYRDSGDGWTVLEVLCHLRDMDEMFFNRAVMIATYDRPDLPFYDHDEAAIVGRYNEEDKDAVYAQLATHRAMFAEWFHGLTEEQWLRSGNHPERPYPFTLTDALMQITLHDNEHLEQITRILTEKRTTP